MSRTPLSHSLSSLSRWFSRHPLAVLLIIFLLALVVRGISLRFEGSFDPDAHFHARMADEIVRTHELVSWDPLSIQGRVYSYPPLLHVLLAVLAQLSGLPSLEVLKYLGTLVGAFFVITVYLLGFELSRSRSIALWSALFAGLSSIAVWRTAGFTRPDGIALTLIPFFLYLWLTHRERVAAVGSVAMVLLHTLSSFIYGIILSIWFLASLTKKVSAPPLLPVAMGGMLIAVGLWFFSIGLPFSDYASHLALDSSELSKFLVLGFVLFFPLSWLFAGVGMWRGNLPLLLVIWLAVTLVIGSLGVRLAMYFIPFFSIAAGYGMNVVLTLLHGKKSTVPALGFLLVLLGMATIWVLMSGIGPYVLAPEHAAISELKAQASPHDSVLTAWDRGHVLTYYTGLPLVIDGYFEFGHELTERNAAMQTAHNTSNCSTFTRAMDEFDAKYFFLAQDQLNTHPVKLGVLELERCPGVRITYSGDGGRIYERLPVD